MTRSLITAIAATCLLSCEANPAVAEEEVESEGYLSLGITPQQFDSLSLDNRSALEKAVHRLESTSGHETLEQIDCPSESPIPPHEPNEGVWELTQRKNGDEIWRFIHINLPELNIHIDRMECYQIAS